VQVSDWDWRIDALGSGFASPEFGLAARLGSLRLTRGKMSSYVPSNRIGAVVIRTQSPLRPGESVPSIC
jgi:hypothetical protein